ncbi:MULTISPECIES: hypothetical protein [unclassified Pseudomonas]|uniref:hypothetical protein n=1 Tax=unclassified Pseudomonas TaxID=196821 RepID=UPI001C60812D|nr:MULTISPECIES: hypothetical protein [unclassified Pseudomonas]MBW5416108.1 hypothetical protein [Pseudomonas sp. MAG002Y]
MSKPQVMLEDLPIVMQAGTVTQRYVRGAEGRSLIRLSKGALVSMRHWSKTTITLSGTGWMGPGFDGLDFDLPLELRCTKPIAITSRQTTVSLLSVPRPDVAPWAEAYVDGVWLPAEVAVQDLVATVDAVSGADLYRVLWMPVFTVYTDAPDESMDPSNATFNWTMTAQEI